MPTDNYYILRVNYLQKVCYIILGDVPGFKAQKIMDEIRSYFEKNNIDISSFLFHVSSDFYQVWLQLLIMEDLIDMDAGKDPVFDVVKLKRHATSIKYELEIEPNATIRSYTCDIPEIAENLFNEWFDDVSKSDKRKEKEMSDNTVSPALSKIEKRIERLKQLESNNDDLELEIQRHRIAIEGLSFEHDELSEDIRHTNERIRHLLNQARIEEGFTEEYLSRFLKEHGFKKQ